MLIKIYYSLQNLSRFFSSSRLRDEEKNSIEAAVFKYVIMDNQLGLWMGLIQRFWTKPKN